jgi:hypothetical protein
LNSNCIPPAILKTTAMVQGTCTHNHGWMSKRCSKSSTSHRAATGEESQMDDPLQYRPALHIHFLMAHYQINEYEIFFTRAFQFCTLWVRWWWRRGLGFVDKSRKNKNESDSLGLQGRYWISINSLYWCQNS